MHFTCMDDQVSGQFASQSDFDGASAPFSLNHAIQRNLVDDLKPSERRCRLDKHIILQIFKLLFVVMDFLLCGHFKFDEVVSA